jgi:hypothetical protein
MKIIYQISDQNIEIVLDDGSSCSLDLVNSEKERMAKLYDLQMDGDLYWFCRLKAQKEGEGRGTYLMRELVDILDRKQAWVFCVVNPYGKMTMEQLESFYKKFDFIKIGEGFMYRSPAILKI